jgi:glycosyltransferase involved in cell wall biosynthesis
MGYPEEAKLVSELLLRLASRVKFSFDLYGVTPDREQEVANYLTPIREAGVEVRTYPPMAYQAFVASLGSVAIGLHPVFLTSPFSRGKSFGKLLAYIAADVAIVTTNAVDHPLFFRDGKSAMLVGDDVDSWVDRCEQLLNQPELRRTLADGARASFEKRLTTRKAAELVAKQFDRAMALSEAHAR